MLKAGLQELLCSLMSIVLGVTMHSACLATCFTRDM
jgi:hypothetical protein